MMQRDWIRKTAIALVAIGLVGLPLFFPNPNGPTGSQWLVAMIEGRGTPHYPVSGTAEAHIENFLNRNPKLRPQWRDVPDEENGLHHALELIREGKIFHPVVRDPLLKFQGNESWDVDAAAAHLILHQELIDEIRRIGQMENRTASVLPISDMLVGNHELARGFKAMSDLLALSMKMRFHQQDIAGALQDFQAIYTLAAHVDQHEIPCQYHATIAVLMRLPAQSVLREAFPKVPPGSDLSSFLEVLENEPKHQDFFAMLFRGEALWGMAIWFDWVTSPDGMNPIWNVEAFADTFAERMLEGVAFFEKSGTLTSTDFVTLEGILTDWPQNLEKAALQELRKDSSAGAGSWMRGFHRAAFISAHTRAALQLHEIERTTGVILSARDPRLSVLVAEPFTRLAFIFDPASRRLTPDLTSSIHNESDDIRVIQLPPPPRDHTHDTDS